MKGGHRTGTLAWLMINIRSSFWFVPMLMTLAAVGLALALVEVEGSAGAGLARRWPRMFGADAEGSRAMLSAIASSMITVAGVVFSITIVALAQASTQYTSRVLRNFMRDRLNQAVLGVFVGVFTYCLLVLRTIGGRTEPFVPTVAVFTGLVLAIVAIGFLIVFIHHIATTIQAGEIARSVMLDTLDVIDRLFPDDLGQEATAPPEAQAGESHPWHPVPARETGYIQSVRPDALLEFAIRHDAVLRMDAGVGEFVIEGRPIAHLAGARAPDGAMVDELNTLYAVDAFRTTDQDAAFGFRQLVDIALKALSPGINDTTTAITSLDYLTVLLQRVARRGLESPYRSEGSRLRVIARGPDFAALTDLAYSQILENAEGNALVLDRMLRSVEEVAAVTAERSRREVLGMHANVIAEVAQRTAQNTRARERLGAAAHMARVACERQDPRKTGSDSITPPLAKGDGGS